MNTNSGRENFINPFLYVIGNILLCLNLGLVVAVDSVLQE